MKPSGVGREVRLGDPPGRPSVAVDWRFRPPGPWWPVVDRRPVVSSPVASGPLSHQTPPGSSVEALSPDAGPPVTIVVEVLMIGSQATPAVLGRRPAAPWWVRAKQATTTAAWPTRGPRPVAGTSPAAPRPEHPMAPEDCWESPPVPAPAPGSVALRSPVAVAVECSAALRSPVAVAVARSPPIGRKETGASTRQPWRLARRGVVAGWGEKSPRGGESVDQPADRRSRKRTPRLPPPAPPGWRRRERPAAFGLRSRPQPGKVGSAEPAEGVRRPSGGSAVSGRATRRRVAAAEEFV